MWPVTDRKCQLRKVRYVALRTAFHRLRVGISNTHPLNPFNPLISESWMIAFDTPFCDYLSVTYSDDSGTPLDLLNSFLPSVGLVRLYGGAPNFDYWCAISAGGKGKMVLRKCVMVKRHGAGLLVTVYGLGFEFFRESCSQSTLSELIGLLSEFRHNLTRCDISMDINVDTPDFYLDFLPKVSSGLFAIRRDSLKVTRIISVRDDGLETGTVYIGKGSNARVKCTIYDKKQERLDNAGERIDDRTRIEFRVTKDFGASLYDVMAPDSLFWFLAYPCGILKNKPVNVSSWEKREGFTRLPQPRKNKDVNHYDVLKDLIYENPFIPTLIEYSDKHIGEDGRKYLINTIRKLVDNPSMGLGLSRG